jgi:hypothetical protein
MVLKKQTSPIDFDRNALAGACPVNGFFAMAGVLCPRKVRLIIRKAINATLSE